MKTKCVRNGIKCKHLLSGNTKSNACAISKNEYTNKGYFSNDCDKYNEKLSNTQLQDRIWKILSQKIKQRDNNCCILCKYNNENYKSKILNAHHYIYNDLTSPKYRFNPLNLVTLCYFHHKQFIHSRSSIASTENIKNAVISEQIITQEKLNEILTDKNFNESLTTENLEEIYKKLL